MHCEGIMSGELKHGPLAMVDKNRSIVMIICSDNVHKVSFFLQPKDLREFGEGDCNFVFPNGASSWCGSGLGLRNVEAGHSGSF